MFNFFFYIQTITFKLVIGLFIGFLLGVLMIFCETVHILYL